MASKKLAPYRAKRDFKRTDEPRGHNVRSAKYPRFVVQKHAATRLHYDLRLEVGGVFKSWAVTRGPSRDPSDKRLAVEVEDHPLDYGDFEGTIPKGEYGAGTVMVWDRGFWAPEDNADVQKALRDGELKFALAGAKLQGSWVLVRMRHDREQGKRNNWLLIKHRDGLEREGDGDALLKLDRSVASQRTMAEIARGKRVGPKTFKTFMRALTNAADPVAIVHSGRTQSLQDETPKVAQSAADSRSKPKKSAAGMPKFIAPQLCTIASKPPSGANWVHEIKFDGCRMQLGIEAGVATLRTRNGLDWTDRFAAIAQAVTKLPNAIIDGEIVALDDNGAPDFSALQAAISVNRSQDLVYFAFDLLFANGEDLRALPLGERKRRLARLIGRKANGNGRIRYVDHLTGAGDAVLKSARSMQLEGIVSKRLDAPYRGIRSASWTKIKCRGGQEVVVGGWSGTRSNVRSLIVGVYRGDQLIHIGRVGTGFNARNTPKLLRELDRLVVDQSPFGGKNAPRRGSDWNWVKPELVAEIEFAGWTGAGMVRQAAFKGLREDKPAEEVRDDITAASTETQVLSPRASSEARKSSGSENSVLGIVITRPDKPLWPAEGKNAAVTKLDLARYLESIGGWMLQHLKGRPCSVVRAPDGLDGESFFQRHAVGGIASLVTLTRVPGDRKPYVQIDTQEALIAMAQVAAVEYHPWNCQPDHPVVPGRLVFDLDPGPDVSFTATIAAARELSDRLKALGLVTFCKTTGGKGLHVVTPLEVKPKSKVGWPEAKAFAQAVCTVMASDSPERYLTNMAKRLRSGRIFLDYLRNDRLSTAVAPLSPRLRPGAPVSMPLNWSQVRANLDPSLYTIRTAPRLLATSKPWADYCDAERPLQDSIKKLVGGRAGKLRPLDHM